MAFKILTENSVDNTNIDGARDRYFNAGGRDGIVKGSLNEGTFTTLASNVISLDTCVLLVSGHPIVIDEAWSQSFSSIPSSSTRYAVVAQILVDENQNVAFDIVVQSASTPLIKNNLFKNLNGAGTYQVEIGRFTLTTNGTIADVVRTLGTITGGSSGMGEHFIAGDMTTTMLDAGMNANATAEDVYDANGNYQKTNFHFEFPETAGTVVKVNDVEQANLDFTSDPQTQLNNRYTKTEADELLDNKADASELNNKLDKKTGTSVVYINDEQGNSATLPYSQASNVGNAIVQRKTGGAIAVPTPTANEDAVPKSYVDMYNHTISLSGATTVITFSIINKTPVLNIATFGDLFDYMTANYSGIRLNASGWYYYDATFSCSPISCIEFNDNSGGRMVIIGANTNGTYVPIEHWFTKSQAQITSAIDTVKIHTYEIS